jgi:hypothetical protein
MRAVLWMLGAITSFCLMAIAARELDGHIDKFELRILLSGEHDNDNALMNIHPGAGGTESQDWTEMLLRHYTKYLENSKILKIFCRYLNLCLVAGSFSPSMYAGIV